MADNDSNNEDGGAKGGPLGVASIVLPVVTALAALVVGAGVGALATWVLTQTPPEKVMVPRDYTAAELQAACAPAVADALTKVEVAEKKVEDLTVEVNQKTAKVSELEAEMKRRGERGRELVKELESAREELITLRAALETALQEKEALVEELKAKVEELSQTKVELAETKENLVESKEDALAAKWTGFIQHAQLEICEKGGRKKMEKCREGVEASLTPPIMDKFRHCVRSEQAIPTVVGADKDTVKGEKPLPEYSEWINQENKITKDYFVSFCDPTLPETSDWQLAPYTPSTIDPALLPPTDAAGIDAPQN